MWNNRLTNDMKREKLYVDVLFERCLKEAENCFGEANMYGAAFVPPDDKQFTDLVNRLHWLPVKLKQLKREINAIVAENIELQKMVDDESEQN